MVHLFDNYASFTNEIFVQLLSNYSRYAASLNMKLSVFVLTLYNSHVYKTLCYTVPDSHGHDVILDSF